MGSVSENKLAGFDVIQATYKQVGDHALRADIIIPQFIRAGKRPIIIRFHGGGLTTGDSLSLDWFPTWVLQLAERYNAVIVSPNYRLLPESTTPEIFSDIEDFWNWLHSPAVPELRTRSSTAVEFDLTRILTAGESAGGLLSIWLALAHPDEIRATTASYPAVDIGSPYFQGNNSRPVPSVPAEKVEKYRAVVARNLPRSSSIFSDMEDLMIAFVVHGGTGHLYKRGIEEDKRVLYYPFERIGAPDAKIPRGGIAILHGLQDVLVPAEHSERFVARASEVFKGKPGGDKISLTLKEGDHGFDTELSLEEEWVCSHFKGVVSAWLE